MDLTPAFPPFAPAPPRTAWGRHLAAFRADILASVTPLIFPTGPDRELAEARGGGRELADS